MTAALLGILALSTVYGTPSRWSWATSFDMTIAWMAWAGVNLALLGAAMVSTFGWPR